MTFDATEACSHCLQPSARFADLAPGERFRFPGSGDVMTRCAGRGYRNARGARFETGAAVAVIRCEPTDGA